MMKKIYLIISSISLALLLSGCGGGGGGTAEGDGDIPSSSGDDGSTTTDGGGTTSGDGGSIIIQVTDCYTYTILYTGDTLVKETDDTVVTIRDNADDSQDVCVNQGAAHILR